MLKTLLVSAWLATGLISSAATAQAMPAAAPVAGETAPAAVGVPFRLQVESQARPLAVERAHPRFSWRSNVEAQAAYEIEVASSPEKLRNGEADLWSSGRIADGRAVAIPYRGMALQSRQAAFWRVRVWKAGAARPGAWSATGSWRMGLLAPSDWQARWIASPPFAPAPASPAIEEWLKATAADPHFTNKESIAETTQILRDMRPATYLTRDFTVRAPVRSAILYSTSAGYSEIFLSGAKVSDRLFNPAQTDFDKRIYYDADDVTDRLTPGAHRLGIHLGNGFFAERTAFDLPALFYGEPSAIAQLEITYEDGSQDVIATDGNWQARPSPILKNGVYSGEVFDARAYRDDWSAVVAKANDAWQPAQSLDTPPTARLVAAEMPPVRRIRSFIPKAMLQPEPGVWVIDFGANLTGVPTVDVAKLGLTAGQALHFRYAEWADAKGNISLKSGHTAPRTKQVDSYIASGSDLQPWSPTFTWHGFRYMEVRGLDKAPPADAFTAHLTRTDIPTIGQFASSSSLLNRVHEAATFSFEGNLVSVPSDCPIRERNGWTGDAHATVRMASFNFGMSTFFEKYLGDFKTTEMIAPTIVPGRRTGSGKIDWAAAEVFLTWEHFLHSGDISVIERQYDNLIRYVDYVNSVAEGDLFPKDRHFYGDWCDPLPTLAMARPLGRCTSIRTPGAVTAAALMVRVFDRMADLAGRIDRPADAVKFAARRDAIARAFHAAYFKPEAGSYGSQTADAMALSFGIVPAPLVPKVAAALEHDVRVTQNGHFSVGALGQTWLYPALSDHGYTDTAYRIFTAKGSPGFSYLLDTLGATTTWEDPTNFDPAQHDAPGKSLNHPFQAGYDAWFYTGLGGINPDPAAPGYKHFFLKPVFPADLGSANVSLETGYGTVESSWTRGKDHILWSVTVPQNTQATVQLGSGGAQRAIGPGRYAMRLSVNGDRLIDVRRQR